MVDITQADLKRVLYLTTSMTYLPALIEATPTGETGTVASAWDLEVTDEGIIIFNEEFGDLILWLEEGTDPYTIKPKNGKFLRFKKPDKPSKKSSKKIPGNITFESDGYIFTQQVNHPGIEARHFVQKVMEDKTLEKQWDDMFSKQLENLINSKLK